MNDALRVRIAQRECGIGKRGGEDMRDGIAVAQDLHVSKGSFSFQVPVSLAALQWPFVMQVLQAGQHKIIYLELQPEMVTKIARDAGLVTEIEEQESGARQFRKLRLDFGIEKDRLCRSDQRAHLVFGNVL